MQDQEYPQPTNLNECFNIIDKIMSKSEVSESDWFKRTNEEEVVATIHHGFGRWIRNNWNLWDKESILCKYFLTMGLWHADDMSSVILTSYHRHINKKDLDLQKQIQYYLDYWTTYSKQNGPISKN